ncbi:hypothetical protein [Spiroplasma eriocheiris]|uniref:Spiralin n=2 Tax=Spiroplasma eriocheiris TaxID=315358 RepID=A0A0H3XMP3_9MOLU|nr:hypothetical protein [Spiroplasma eriocheiris]ACY78504.1 spiralin [Spiroplasma eriocheiris CCTCC M 207170]AHF57825.1 hypothetical protein SPE_0701 [Spiroplasma eriocheiris CCTCC M 207170]AKM54272.1 hypothetical protein SERIO_v1c07080 [Spiroplasma eriocheiris]
MKKLIAILGAGGLMLASTSSIIACNDKPPVNKENNNDLLNSFKSSYNANNTGIDLSNYGIEQSADYFNFTFSKLQTNLLKNIIIPNKAATVTKVDGPQILQQTSPAANSKIAIIEGINQSKLHVDDGILQIKINLQLYQALAQKDGTIAYQRQSETMIITINLKAKFNIALINTIPAISKDEFHVQNYQQVTKKELDLSFADKILAVVRQYVPRAIYDDINNNVGDFKWTWYLENHQELEKPLDLTTSPVLFIKILSEPASDLLTGATNFIKIVLPSVK